MSFINIRPFNVLYMHGSPTNLELHYLGADPGKPNVLFTHQMCVHTSLCVPNDQETSTHVTNLILLVKVPRIYLKPSNSLWLNNQTRDEQRASIAVESH